MRSKARNPVPDIFIPPKTVEKLNGAHPKGTRHQAKIDICLPLLGSGLSPAAVEQTLIEKFPEASLAEIQSVIRWCWDKNPQPAGYGRTGTGAAPLRFNPVAVRQPVKTARSHADQCDWWLNGKKTTPAELAETSPVKFKGAPAAELTAFLELLYQPDEKLNIVCKFTLRGEKANPQGAGRTMTRQQWCDYIRHNGVPQSEAGAWLRMNPCKDGSGEDGAITDADVTAHRFMLLESDDLPPETLIALFQNLGLPLAAIFKSGGKSVHGWVKLESPDATAYAQAVKQVIELLEPFGLDKSNKNPSRLSRLPSAVRKIQAQGDGCQSLLWLNPAAKPLKPEEIELLRARLSVPLADEQPMRALMRQSVGRYEELYHNRGKLGVRVGFEEFDQDTGGFKPGQKTVIAAETNKGKTTMLINMLYGALLNGHGVALFTQEMDREEIIDLIIANHCRVNRNAFNTGYFDQLELVKIINSASAISKLPLWIFDDAVMTVEEMDKRLTALGDRVDLVGVDYLQILSASDPRLSREQQVAEIARDIRILAKRKKLPFIVLSQLNDEGKLRESRVVGHEAHNVILLDLDEQTFRVVKGRRIPKKDYALVYEPQYARVTMPLIHNEDVPNPHND